MFAYADPPFPGTAHIYRDRPTYRGEVDHEQLVASLVAARLDGWALSTSRQALRDVLPLCPPNAWPCPWVKPVGVARSTYGLHTTHEYLIVVGGRRRRPGVRDWLRAMPARGGGDLVGRKPIAFCAFLFRALGMQPGDVLVDLYPGSGAVHRAWEEASARTSRPERALDPRVIVAPATWPAEAAVAPRAATLLRRAAPDSAPRRVAETSATVARARATEAA